MKELILGGVRSGKSALAQQRAEASDLAVTYIATATAGDESMVQRIARHQADRPTDWQTLEVPLLLADALQQQAADNCCLIVDCLTLWLTNLFMKEDDTYFHTQRDGLLELLPDLPGHIILVSNEINMGVVPTGELSRRFCDEAGWLHQALGKICDRVSLTVAGLPLEIKG